MKFDYKGYITSENTILEFVSYLETIDDNSLWIFRGLKVEIDPTVDYTNSNILVRLYDVEEGFSDKIIYYKLAEFKKDFQIINA